MISNLNLFPADTWPQVFDDSKAREDWGWMPRRNIDDLVDIMIDSLLPVYADKKPGQKLVI